MMLKERWIFQNYLLNAIYYCWIIVNDEDSFHVISDVNMIVVEVVDEL